jgi:hypothetical protein
VAFGLGGCVLDLGPPIPDEQVMVPTTPTTSNPVPKPTTPSDADADTGSVPVQDDTPEPSDPVEAATPIQEAGSSGTSSSPDDGGTTPTVPADTCGVGFIECDGGCALGDTCEKPPTCEETCHYDHAQSECVDEVCMFVGCDEGWVDCDGKPETGCEVDFGSSTPRDPISLPQLTITEDDDWAGVPVYPLTEPCGDCGQDFSNEPAQAAVFKDMPAPSGDLMAGVSLAWSTAGLSLRAVIYDDQTVVRADLSGANTSALYYDNLHITFDGGSLSNAGEAQDHHLFLGRDGNAFDQQIPEASRLRDLVSVDVEPLGVCQLLHAQISTDYLSGGNPMTLDVGNTYGFALNINDYDKTDDTPPKVQRQHSEFLLTPGENYVYGPRTLPKIRLVDVLSMR